MPKQDPITVLPQLYPSHHPWFSLLMEDGAWRHAKHTSALDDVRRHASASPLGDT